jgi:hypothetical protein
MGILFPSLENIKKLKVQPTDGEWYLLNYFIENSPSDIEVYFQPFLNGDMPDIILMNKNLGVTIIEVKDWNLNSYYLNLEKNNLGDWILKQNNHILKSPFKQVFRYKDNMFNLHINGLLEKKILNKKFYGRINVFVYFHNATSSALKLFYSQIINHLELEIQQCLGHKESHKKHLINQHTKLKKQRDYYSITNDTISKITLPHKADNLFPEDIYNEFKRYLQPPFHTIEQGIDINYSDRQKELSKSKASHQKIKGVAGSGKTLVLAKRVVNSYKRHQSNVLILTFNITLTSYIHDMISNVREDFSWDNFTILHYHVFFSSMANNYGMDIENNTDYENTIFFENAKGKIVKYEAIFIDEIQDYKQEWIEIIKKYFLKENGEFVVFGDEKQNIYDRKLENKKPNTTILGAWNLLKESFRLDSKIASLAEKFQNNFFINKYDIDTIEIKQKKQGAFDFETNIINIYKYADIKNLLVAIFNIVKKHNIHSNDICILSYTIDILREVDYQIRHDYNEKTLTTFETQEVLSFLKKEYKDINILKSEIENVRRVKKFGFRLNNGMIKLSTIHSFKGWETPTLFLIIDEEKLNTEVEEAIYIAITRARHNIIIFDLREGKYYEFFKNSIEGL